MEAVGQDRITESKITVEDRIMNRRYAFNGRIEGKLQFFDVVVVGSGVAGLYCALNLDASLSCAVITKAEIENSNSWFAQGGIAAVTKADDNTRDHFNDTMKAGAQICNPEAVDVLVTRGPEEIKRLMQMHVPFDHDKDGNLLVTREGGHGTRRILHCGGDATGRITLKTLEEQARGRNNIHIMGKTLLVDILTDQEGKAAGVVIWDERESVYRAIGTNRVILSTGGAGQVFKRTTNPPGATGDGIAAAMRAGAQVKDLEFVQFHPTAMYREDDANQFFLISEAVRGEGGILKNKYGEPFMEGKHPLKELAPRDIVTRCIVAEMERTGRDYVELDITHKDKAYLEKRFPTIYTECLKLGVDMSKDLIKVCPVQHYLMGGLVTDTSGRTSVPHLYACGEAACTGVHGGNRLASNSLLECLVFGRRCAEDINRDYEQGVWDRKPHVTQEEIDASASVSGELTPPLTEEETDRLRMRIKELMTQKCGVIRRGEQMAQAKKEIEAIYGRVCGSQILNQRETELLNIATVAEGMLEGALARKESVGAHYRVD